MKRIRSLGIAAVLALALTAFAGVGSVSASSFVSEAKTANTVLKTEIASGHIFKNITFSEIACGSSSFEATMTSQATEFSTSWLSNYSCSIFGATTLKTNGCQYTFHPKAEVKAGTFAGTFDIGPAGCGPMTVTYSGGACTISIYPKTGLGATFENTGSGAKSTVTIFPQGKGLKYADTCAKSGENGEYTTGSWQVKAFESIGGSPGNQVGLRVEAKTGVYLAGEKSESEAKQPKLNAEVYPRAISASQSSAHIFTTSGTKQSKCTGAELSASLSAASAALSVTGTYSGCEAFEFATAPRAMNSCHYVLKVANAGPPYSGTAEIVCTKEGDAITITPTIFGQAYCVVSFPAQTIGAVTFENQGTGINRHVVATVKGEGLKYNSTVSYCGTKGWNEDGKFSGAFDLVGVE